MPSCHFCGAAMNLGDPIGREAACESCGQSLRCCRQCRHYDTNYHNSCRETEADMVEDKERGNFCEFFYFSREPFRPVAATGDRQGEARAKLEGLFKPAADRKAPDRAGDARSKLDALFRKPDPDE